MKQGLRVTKFQYMFYKHFIVFLTKLGLYMLLYSHMKPIFVTLLETRAFGLVVSKGPVGWGLFKITQFLGRVPLLSKHPSAQILSQAYNSVP